MHGQQNIKTTYNGHTAAPRVNRRSLSAKARVLYQGSYCVIYVGQNVTSKLFSLYSGFTCHCPYTSVIFKSPVILIMDSGSTGSRSSKTTVSFLPNNETFDVLIPSSQTSNLLTKSRRPNHPLDSSVQ